jgi:hypothetical protein
LVDHELRRNLSSEVPLGLAAVVHAMDLSRDVRLDD